MPSESPTRGKNERIHIVKTLPRLHELTRWKSAFSVYHPPGSSAPVLVVGRWVNPESGRESAHYIIQKGLALLLGGDGHAGTDICRGYFTVTQDRDNVFITVTGLSDTYLRRPDRGLSEAARAAERAFLSLERGVAHLYVDFDEPEEDRFNRLARSRR